MIKKSLIWGFWLVRFLIWCVWIIGHDIGIWLAKPISEQEYWQNGGTTGALYCSTYEDFYNKKDAWICIERPTMVHWLTRILWSCLWWSMGAITCYSCWWADIASGDWKTFCQSCSTPLVVYELIQGGFNEGDPDRVTGVVGYANSSQNDFSKHFIGKQHELTTLRICTFGTKIDCVELSNTCWYQYSCLLVFSVDFLFSIDHFSMLSRYNTNKYESYTITYYVIVVSIASSRTLQCIARKVHRSTKRPVLVLSRERRVPQSVLILVATTTS